MRKLFGLILLVVCFAAGIAQSAVVSPWIAADLGFRPVALTANGPVFWTCGSGEGIASSTDGQTWRLKHSVSGGELLLGLVFYSEKFGYAFGTGGILLFTNDGGQTWTESRIGNETILLAAFSDSQHGVLRTRSSLRFVSGGNSQPIPIPANVPSDFHDTPSVAAISSDRMAVELSEGWRSRTGFLSTLDGGKNWTFFEPPHIVTYDFLRISDHYWAVGTETVGYDKPGGGLGVPVVMNSTDGRTWQHATTDVEACHWQGCNACKAQGCLASASLIVDPFGSTSAFYEIPKGHLSAQWAATHDEFCSIDGLLYCVPLEPAKDGLRGGGGPQPEDSAMPPLGAKSQTGLLRCISCELAPMYIDPKAEGRYTLHLKLVVAPEGTLDSVEISGAPNQVIAEKVHAQALTWLFEPPKKDGHPVRVSTATSALITVVRSR